jgi:hypothetical protein
MEEKDHCEFHKIALIEDEISEICQQIFMISSKVVILPIESLTEKCMPMKKEYNERE